jgi:hypothetical protein
LFREIFVDRFDEALPEVSSGGIVSRSETGGEVVREESCACHSIDRLRGFGERANPSNSDLILEWALWFQAGAADEN